MVTRIALEKRLKDLEAKTRPPIISTLADYVLWCANHADGEKMPPLSPEMEEALSSIKKSKSARAEREAATLAKVRGLEEGAMEREEEARQLRGEAEDLKPKARLEDLSVYQVEKVKPTAKGEVRTYKYWYASWWEGDRARNVYLGSTAKLSEAAALEKARKMKAEALGLDL